MKADGPKWWQRGVVYQIYPRSFQDSDGDGIGDLRGIVSRLDYLEWLGVDAVWISPFYPSPMSDFGYDITDHKGVHPMFGTLDDFDALVEEAHHRNIRVILDYVPNHTSEEHPWFAESRSSHDNPKRDWYIWADPAPDGGSPNNWIDTFGQGGAWAWDEGTGQYYYHAHLREQPDLNWRNPEVREVMLDVLSFWLERNVDGFRVDALRHLIKDRELRDNPPNPDYRPGDRPFDALLPVYNTDRPEIHDAIAAMRRVLDEHDAVMIGELYLPIERLVAYYGADGSGVHLPFNFHLLSTPWNAREIASLVGAYEAALPPDAWPNWVLGNHDRARIASRVEVEQARIAAMLLLTLRGTPTLYYGDEIGMRDVPIPPELIQDPFGKNVPTLGRDPARTPMQWDGTANAGFCPDGIEPWLPIVDAYPTVNVAAERKDPTSMLTLHRLLLALHRDQPALTVGSYKPLEATDDLLAYTREKDARRFMIVLNLGHRSRTFASGEIKGRLALSTHLDRDGERVDGMLELRGDEGVIVEQG